MASKKQIHANQLNAQKSTGPRTPQGKAVSRFNNLQHGVCAQTLVLPFEDQQDFDHIRGSFEEEFEPQSPSESVFVEQLAVAQWKLRRIQKAQNALLLQDPDGLQNLSGLDRLYRLELRFQHAFLATYQELNRIRTQRLKQAAQEESEEEEESEMKPAIKFCPGLMWIQNGEDYEASPPKIKHPDGTWEVLYPGDPRRKEYGWNFEPDREHSREWDPKTDPRKKPPPQPPPPVPSS